MTDTALARPPGGRTPPPWIGAGLALALAGAQGWNALRTAADPAGFVAYMALPEGAFVQVYGLRALFIALLVVVFLTRRDWSALSIVAAVALVMPLGDAALTLANAGPPAVVARHLAIAAVVALAAVVLNHLARRT